MKVELPHAAPDAREATDARQVEETRDEKRARLRALFTETRARTESFAARLSAEDQQLQSMPDTSPTKWHRAHTTWFFETFVLVPLGVDVVDSSYGFLFNSYYEASGPRHTRAKRGLVSRPSAAEVLDYRRIVDDRVRKVFATAGAAALDRILTVIELGIAHEEQHQELLLTDILHAFSENPLLPSLLSPAAAPLVPPRAPDEIGPLRFVPFEGGLHEVGAPDALPFAFDNERPRHKEWVAPFALGDRLVTVRELKAFIDEGGYRTPSLWLSEGFDFIRANGVTSPLHSIYEDGALHLFTLAGRQVASDDEPVTHVSYYEADAIARFLGARLPTEVEWELAAARVPVRGNFVDDGKLRASPALPGSGTSGTGRERGVGDSNSVRQLFGDTWEWTRSSYEAYPGYEPPAGALGEYNGKFMINQRVLRGGSCLTPQRHVRASYRNFWHAPTRFQMTGVRLAREVKP
jgi:ergothioneine biosynthesis protein EgtB